jgi:hypothetical protein
VATEAGPSFPGGRSCALPQGTHRLATPIPRAAVALGGHSRFTYTGSLSPFQGNLPSLAAEGKVSPPVSLGTKQRRTC